MTINTNLTIKNVFVTTGTQLPFVRLLDAVNQWAQNNPSAKVIAQNAQLSQQWDHLETHQFLLPSAYADYCKWADVIVGHAGMGTIITGFEYEKPLILMPRLFAQGEHRNDHQLATAQKFQGRTGIHIVANASELETALNTPTGLNCNDGVFENRENLISALRTLILDE